MRTAMRERGESYADLTKVLDEVSRSRFRAPNRRAARRRRSSVPGSSPSGSAAARPDAIRSPRALWLAAPVRSRRQKLRRWWNPTRLFVPPQPTATPTLAGALGR
jgi:hypothetical protein